ncbi:MAG: glycosyltransferase family 2 protein [Clostridiales bacterium]|nr:glycosyltransferase family 2 protein [Clostridiales bacterium]
MNLLQKDRFNNQVATITVSVIVATYKREESLKRALKSLINQTYDSIEIIVVDDNADNEWNKKVEAIINEINKLHPIVYIKNKTNKGSAETRNIGINISSGEYITFLDDDDVYLPNKIKNQIEHMIENDSDYSITDLDLYDENERLIEKRTRKYIKESNKDNLLRYHLMYHMTGTDTLMFKKDYLLSIGGFPHINVGDEFYLIQKAIETGGIFSYLPLCDVKAYVHTETDGLSSGEGKIKGENLLYEYKKKYFLQLSNKEIRYIKMRHYAVLAFAEVRKKNAIAFIKYSIYSFINSPCKCVSLVLSRKKQ